MSSSNPNSTARASASNNSNSTASPPTLNASGLPRKRRLNLACIECKTRKIKCDRNIPQCASCIKRGVAHKCRWGDERDESNPAPALSNDATTSALLARVLQKEQRIKLLEAKLKAAGIAYQSKADLQDMELDGLEDSEHIDEGEEQAAMKQIDSTALSHPVWFGSDSTADSKGKAPEHTFKMFSTPQDNATDPRALPHNLNSLLSLLPPPERINEVVTIYLDEMERWVSCFHTPTLKCQIERIVSSLDWYPDGSVRLKDASRIRFDEVAMLFSIHSSLISTSSSPCWLSSQKNYTAYHEASLEFLSYSRFWDSPTLAGIQCLIVMRYYCLTKNSLNFSRALTASAIRMAEVMSLHRLGSYEADEKRWRAKRDSGKKRKLDQLTEIVKDAEMEMESQTHQESAFYLPVQAQNKARERSLAFGEGSHVTRETGRRIWWSLKVQDEFQGLLTSDSGQFEYRGANATALPLNIDDEDLLDDIYPLKTQPYQVPTLAAYLERIHDLNGCIRIAVEASSHAKGYTSVIEIDSKIRKLLEELPDVLSYNKCGETGKSRRLREERPYLKYHRESIQHWCHEYLLSIHRSYASRGYLEPQFRLSLQTSISSARMIISILRDPTDQNQKGASLSILCNLFFVLSALLTHLLHESANSSHHDESINRIAEEEIKDIKADVDFGIESMKAFFYPQGTPEQRSRTERAISILTVLRNKVDARHPRIEAESESIDQEHKRRHTLPNPNPLSIAPDFNQHHRLSSGTEIPPSNYISRPQLFISTPASALSSSDQEKLDKDLDDFVAGLLQSQPTQAQSQVPAPLPSPSFPLLPNLDELLWTPTNSYPLNMPNPDSTALDQDSTASAPSHLNYYASTIPRSQLYQYPPQSSDGRSQYGSAPTSMGSISHTNLNHSNLF